MKAVGEKFAEQRADRRKETNTAVEEVKRGFKAALEAFELRLMAHVDRRISEHIAQTTERTSTLRDMIVTERLDRQKEIKDTVEELQSAAETRQAAKLEASEQRVVQHTDRRINEHIAQTTERTGALGDTLAKERRDWQSEIKSVVDTAQNSFKTELNASFAALEQRVVQHTDRRINEHIAQTTERTSTLRDMIVTERLDRQKEIKDTVEEAQSAAETRQAAKLEALDQRVVQHTDQRINQHIEQYTERTHALSDVIATERWDRQKETKAAVEDAKREFATKLEALEQRIVQHTNQPIIGRDGGDADPEAVARIVGERIEAPLHEFVRAQIDTKFTALEERLKAAPQAEQQANINGGPRSISASSTSSGRWMGVLGPAHCTRPRAQSSRSLSRSLKHWSNVSNRCRANCQWQRPGIRRV